MRLILFMLFSILLSFCLRAEEPIRTWTSSDGLTLEARFIEQVGSNVRIKNEAGREFTLPITRFSQADQVYVNQAYGRSFFAEPQPFEDEGSGGVIVASAKGSVEVMLTTNNQYSDQDPFLRAVIVGESISSGATLITGDRSSADLLLTNGTLAHMGEDTKLVLTTLYQKAFRGNKAKAIELKEEVSASRTVLKLEEGDLVLEVRKLGKESSFLISTEVAQAGIRGTQFKLSARADSAEVSVLEGRADFLDSEQMATPVGSAKKAGALKGGSAKLEDMSVSEQAMVKQAVEQTRQASKGIDLNRLAVTIDGYTFKPNYIVKSALDMEMIWCPPGSFIMGPGGEGAPAHPVILTQGFYLGKYELTQEQYQKLMGTNPSKFKGNNLPVEEVTWTNAVAFCEALSKKERIPRGWEFALPTEAEWEYACRAGTSTSYSWGNSVRTELANYVDSGKGMTIAVGSYEPNLWGFHDMHGNVREWVADYLGSYPPSTVFDPSGPNFGEKNIQRGGSWGNVGSFMHSRRRGNGPTDSPSSVLGFRVSLKKSK